MLFLRGLGRFSTTGEHAAPGSRAMTLRPPTSIETGWSESAPIIDPTPPYTPISPRPPTPPVFPTPTTPRWDVPIVAETLRPVDERPIYTPPPSAGTIIDVQPEITPLPTPVVEDRPIVVYEPVPEEMPEEPPPLPPIVTQQPIVEQPPSTPPPDTFWPTDPPPSSSPPPSAGTVVSVGPVVPVPGSEWWRPRQWFAAFDSLPPIKKGAIGVTLFLALLGAAAVAGERRRDK